SVPAAGADASCALASIGADIGQAGAAAGLASVVKAALCLHQQILPSPRPEARWPRKVAALTPPAFLPAAPQYWLRNRADGPRRAAVSASSLGGNCIHVVLEESSRQETPTSERRLERSHPLGARRLGLFAIEADDEAGLSERIRELV